MSYRHRVAFVSHAFMVGGAEEMVLNLVRHLPERFEPVIVCLHEAGPIGEEIRKTGVEFHVLDLNPGIRHPFHLIKLERALTDRFGNHRHVGDVRGRGLFWAIELVADRATKAVFDPVLKMNERVKAEGLARGLATYPMGGTIDGKRGDLLEVRGQVELDIFGFVQLSGEFAFEPFDGRKIQVVGGLVQQQQVGLLPGHQRERQARLLAAGGAPHLAEGVIALEAEAAQEVADLLLAGLR